MSEAEKKSIVEGFTVEKKQLNKKINEFRKNYYEQNYCQDPIKFITDKLFELGFVDKNFSNKDKYSLVNRYMVKEDLMAGLKDSFERYHSRPNPNYSYDNGGSRYLEWD